MTEFVFLLLAAYLLGSISGGVLLGRLRGTDIRTMGSHNPGGSNALRTQGVWFALAVLVIDMGKGALAAGLLPKLWSLFEFGDEPFGGHTLVLACTIAAMVGHIFPLWHRFRGGKGVATFFGATLVTQPVAAAVLLPVWISVVIIGRYASVATLVSAALYWPLSLALAPAVESRLYFWAGLLITVMLIATHWQNIVRLVRGCEYRITLP